MGRGYTHVINPPVTQYSLIRPRKKVNMGGGMVYSLYDEKRLLTTCGMWGVLMREIHAGFHGVSAGGVGGELCLSIGYYRVSSHSL